VSKIEIGRYSELLRRMLGQKGQEIVAAELSPEVSPIIILEGTGAEWDFLKSVRGCRCQGAVVGQPGFSSRFRLRNPVNSGVIAVIDEVGFSGAGVKFRMGRAQIFGDHPAPLLTVVPDLRWGSVGATTTTLLFSKDNTSALGIPGDLFMQIGVAADNYFKYTQPTVLVPGTSLEWGTNILDSDIDTYVAWRERALPDLEG